MTRPFAVGEKVKTDHPPAYIDATDNIGVVEGYHDWWVLVRMDKSGVLFPYMEGELKHVAKISL